MWINIPNSPADIHCTALAEGDQEFKLTRHMALTGPTKGEVVVTKPIISVLLTVLAIAPTMVWAQALSGDDVQAGKRLAIMICAACHVASLDQPNEPILQPPAPDFGSIARNGSISAESLENFLATTHRDIGNPKGMPNPQLADYQRRAVISYLLSLRKQP
jgi:mono/diheme cytochrome c family protein